MFREIGGRSKKYLWATMPEKIWKKKRINTVRFSEFQASASSAKNQWAMVQKRCRTRQSFLFWVTSTHANKGKATILGRNGEHDHIWEEDGENASRGILNYEFVFPQGTPLPPLERQVSLKLEEQLRSDLVNTFLCSRVICAFRDLTQSPTSWPSWKLGQTIFFKNRKPESHPLLNKFMFCTIFYIQLRFYLFGNGNKNPGLLNLQRNRMKAGISWDSKKTCLRPWVLV